MGRKPLAEDYADAAGVHYVIMRNARRRGIASVIEQTLTDLESRVYTIYFTVDMDVLDIAYDPGALATTPGGMRNRRTVRSGLFG